MKCISYLLSFKKNSLTNLLKSLSLGLCFVSFPEARKAKCYGRIPTRSYSQRKKTNLNLIIYHELGVHNLSLSDLWKSSEQHTASIEIVLHKTFHKLMALKAIISFICFVSVYSNELHTTLHSDLSNNKIITRDSTTPNGKPLTTSVHFPHENSFISN